MWKHTRIPLHIINRHNPPFRPQSDTTAITRLSEPQLNQGGISGVAILPLYAKRPDRSNDMLYAGLTLTFTHTHTHTHTPSGRPNQEAIKPLERDVRRNPTTTDATKCMQNNNTKTSVVDSMANSFGARGVGNGATGSIENRRGKRGDLN